MVWIVLFGDFYAWMKKKCEIETLGNCGFFVLKAEGCDFGCLCSFNRVFGC